LVTSQRRVGRNDGRSRRSDRRDYRDRDRGRTVIKEHEPRDRTVIKERDREPDRGGDDRPRPQLRSIQRRVGPSPLGDLVGRVSLAAQMRHGTFKPPSRCWTEVQLPAHSRETGLGQQKPGAHFASHASQRPALGCTKDVCSRKVSVFVAEAPSKEAAPTTELRPLG
jgi:hypothetical protein